jgi:hypothetical protein
LKPAGFRDNEAIKTQVLKNTRIEEAIWQVAVEAMGAGKLDEKSVR